MILNLVFKKIIKIIENKLKVKGSYKIMMKLILRIINRTTRIKMKINKNNYHRKVKIRFNRLIKINNNKIII